MKIKRIIALLLALVLSLSLVACDQDGGSKKKKKKKDDEALVGVSMDFKKSSVEEAFIYSDGDFEVVLCEQDLGIEDGALEIEFEFENKSNQNVQVSFDKVVLNGIVFETYTGIEAAAGEDEDGAVVIFEEELAIAQIKGIEELEFFFSFMETESYETLFNVAPVSILTDLPDDDYKQEYGTNATMLTNEGGMEIGVIAPVDDGFGGYKLYFYIENNTGKDVVLSGEDIYVNGQDGEDFLYAELMNGQKTYEYIWFDETSLEELNISAVEEFEMEYTVYNIMNYDTLLQSKIAYTY